MHIYLTVLVDLQLYYKGNVYVNNVKCLSVQAYLCRYCGVCI